MRDPVILPSTDADNKALYEMLRQYNRRFAAPRKDYDFHVEEEGKLVAGITGTVTLDTLEIEYLCVAPDHRGQGLGTALMRHAEETARADGLSQILVWTYSYQAPAFYEKLGYERLFAVDPCFGDHRQIFYRKRLEGARTYLPDTERLRFRPYTWDDFDDLRAIISDPETMAFYDKPYDDNGVRRWIGWNLDNYRDLGFGLWALERKDTGEFIGDCGITMQIIDRKIVPEIGYHIRKADWNKGYATEAARACKDWIFTHSPFDTVYSYMNADNIGSVTVALHNGMTEIGSYEDNGERLKVCAVTRAEWIKEKE